MYDFRTLTKRIELRLTGARLVSVFGSWDGSHKALKKAEERG